MIVNRKFRTAFTLGVVAMATVLVTVDADAQRKPKPKTLLKMATLAPEGSTWMKTMEAMDTEVREATGNAVGFKFYPNMVQGDENVVLRRIRNGQLHGGGFTGSGLGEIAPSIRALELPFLFRDDTEVDAVHAALDETFSAEMEENGFVLLGWAEVGSVHLFTNEPVRNPEDMKHVKMWLWEGDPVAEAMFETFSIPPIPLSIAHVMTSLQTGMIDGVYSSPYGCIALQWFTRVKYMTNQPVAHATAALVVSKKTFDKLSAEHATTVREISRRYLDELVAQSRSETAEALLELERNGMEFVVPDAVQLDGFRAKARGVWQSLAGKLYSEELLAQIGDVLEQHRSQMSDSNDTEN
jgi:TRAP-type C4-dicarboxylate transport system substrate-binding protein